MRSFWSSVGHHQPTLLFHLETLDLDSVEVDTNYNTNFDKNMEPHLSLAFRISHCFVKDKMEKFQQDAAKGQLPFRYIFLFFFSFLLNLM